MFASAMPHCRCNDFPAKNCGTPHPLYGCTIAAPIASGCARHARQYGNSARARSTIVILFQLCFWVSRKQKEMEEKEGRKEDPKKKKKERKENDHNQNNIRGSLGAVAHLAAQRCHLNSTVGSARKSWHPRVSSAVVTSASVWPSACTPLATVALHSILRRAQCRWCRWQWWRGWRDATSIGPRASNSLLHR